MPKQIRWRMKRLADQAQNDLVRAQTNLAALAVIYADSHKDIAQVWEGCFSAIQPIKDVIERQTEGI